MLKCWRFCLQVGTYGHNFMRKIYRNRKKHISLKVENGCFYHMHMLTAAERNTNVSIEPVTLVWRFIYGIAVITTTQSVEFSTAPSKC
jgi:hypothetical protein